MSDLAGIAAGSLSRLSHTVKNLEQQGWVARRPCPGDGRTTLATLTDAGMAKLVASAPGHVAEVRRLVVEALSAEEMNQLGDISRTVVAQVLPANARALDLTHRRAPSHMSEPV